ncbi:putative alpha-1,2-mannosidase [Mucilaginibacter gracilis]|uniref:Putative alpha-1,2-mannosidase n=1 Tax=Mucilaginibacter gracilis TaxID=423350 RepID=A0A495J959_9SPHI|nr:GH92 family glycosyl hydrolase [Mucilaginibacter gracilis]RKR84589.1 putative alpha-1,2-mannosidase [Mucilaginibacter gracilis]
MKKQISLMLFLLFAALASKSQNGQKSLTGYVNTFIGAADNGHTFPGATVPFGMIQASPETGNCSWDYCSGYRYEDKKIWGFAQTHLNGTGVPDLGDILLQPFTGSTERENYHSAYAKKVEIASPGYYSVILSDFDVKVELTATAHTAFHQYTYPANKGAAKLLVDLQSGLVSSQKQLHEHVIENKVTFEGDDAIVGYSRVKQWVDRNYYYVIIFNKPIFKTTLLPKTAGDKAPRYVFDFDLKPSEKLKVKIGISCVSIAGAKNNLQTESPGWDFQEIHHNAVKAWDRYLSRAEVQGTPNQKVSFYTSLYHLFIQPNNIADVDGQYRGADNKVYKSLSKTYYSTFSLWDTYRAAHPLYTILAPEKVNDFVNTMLMHFDRQGYLPIWTLWGKENFCMIGNHAVPVIADAYLKGFRGFDAEKAFNAINSSLTTNHPKSEWDIYNKYGYLPFDLVKEESVSRTLEYAYDDYSAAQMAKALGKTEEYAYFKKRSDFYKNLIDPESTLMRGKDSKGQWRTPFNRFQLSHAGDAGGDYTEGNAWQYTWSVQHGFTGLTGAMGGKLKTAQKLDSLYKLKPVQQGSGFVSDVTGLIGQYAHGNEPSHHVAYLFALLDKPSRTQELVREINDKFYLNKPDGLSGNDDCGQMSAWYVFTAMGFYPVNPVGGQYVLGAPQLPYISIRVTDNKRFTVTAEGLSKHNKYVQKVYLNGKVYHGLFINHKDIMNGGTLKFMMGNRKRDFI